MKGLSVAILLLVTCAASADTITIRADSWCPMNCEPGSERPGYMIELAREIAEAHGHEVEYKTMPWERALHSVREGKDDCVVGAYIEDAPDFRFPEQHWGLDETAVYAAADSDLTYTDLESFRGQKVGIIGGYAYSDEFDAFAESNPDLIAAVNADNALESNIQKLLAGRISMTLESPSVMGNKLKEMGLQGKLKRIGTLGGTNQMYIACSPAKEATAEYIELFDAGTEKLRASGRLQEILAEYGLEDWQT